jgi:hypothetical protein
MVNVAVDTGNIRKIYTDRLMMEHADELIVGSLIGEVGDLTAPIIVPHPKNDKGRTVGVPLLNLDTGEPSAEGADIEGTGTVPVYSSTAITVTEKPKAFKTPGRYESNQAVMNAREDIIVRMKEWAAAYIDKQIIQAARNTTPAASFPARASRSTSYYNVEYIGDVETWNDITIDNKLSARTLSKAKRYFQLRNIAPCKFRGMRRYLVFLPSEALFDLQFDEEFRDTAKQVLPPSKDHPLWADRGLQPEFDYDGMLLINDLRPAFGSTNKTYLHVDPMTNQQFIKFEAIFMGAGALAYYDRFGWEYSEKLSQARRVFEAYAVIENGVAIPKIQLSGSVNSVTDSDYRHYGIGYICGAASKLQ